MMNSFGRLKILKQIDGGETQSYVVFDPERKREVLLHILPQERTAANRAVWERLDAGLEAARKIVLDRGDLLGVQYVITEYLREFESLAQMLAPPSAPNKAPAPAQKTAPAGEFTQLFQAAASPGGEAPTESMAAGEFTRMFQPKAELKQEPLPPFASGALKPVPPPPLPAQPASVKPEPRPSPGEFTKLFQGSTAAPAPTEAARVPDLPQEASSSVNLKDVGLFQPVVSPEAAPMPKLKPKPPDLFAPLPQPSTPPLSPKTPGTAEFTKYFQEPLGKGSAADMDFSKKVPAPLQREPKKPGEFTRMFGRPFSQQPIQKSSGLREEPGGATGVFSSKRSSAAPRSESSGPGEFTRQFQSSAPPHVAPPVASAAGTAAPSAKASMPVLLLAVLGALLVFAVALVLYFVLKH